MKPWFMILFAPLALCALPAGGQAACGGNLYQGSACQTFYTDQAICDSSCSSSFNSVTEATGTSGTGHQSLYQQTLSCPLFSGAPSSCTSASCITTTPYDDSSCCSGGGDECNSVTPCCGSMQCSNGICIAGCTSDSDCLGGLVCQSGTCGCSNPCDDPSCSGYDASECNGGGDCDPYCDPACGGDPYSEACICEYGCNGGDPCDYDPFSEYCDESQVHRTILPKAYFPAAITFALILPFMFSIRRHNAIDPLDDPHNDRES